MRKDVLTVSKAQNTKIIFSIIGISFIQGLQFCISPVLGQIQEFYPDVSVSMIQMLITAPALIAMIVALIAGWLAVKISIKKLLLFGGIIAGVTGFLPFLAGQFWLLLVSRILYGIGMGLATALNLSVVAAFFAGAKRTQVMGIQAASVGAGMVVVTTAGGILGRYGFQYAYFIHIIGFISAFVIAVCLPDPGIQKNNQTESIQINKTVIRLAVFGMIEFLFLIAFSTNIAMHLGGSLKGDTTASGTLAGVFSGAQIVIGLILGYIAKVTKKYTLPCAMVSFSIGALLLVLFPASMLMLTIGAIFCGFSQGVFVPQAMVEVSNAVSPASTTMAAACFTCGMCTGQLLSPAVLNTASRLILGETTTKNVYIVSAAAMVIAAGLFAGMIKRQAMEE